MTYRDFSDEVLHQLFHAKIEEAHEIATEILKREREEGQNENLSRSLWLPGEVLFRGQEGG
jgi:hypothetical protein